MRKNLALDIAPITPDEFVMAPIVSNKIHQATQTIVRRGGYTNPEGVDVSIQGLQENARQQGRTYAADHAISVPSGRYTHTHAYVYNQSTLTIAHARVRQGYRVAVLNYANPPGANRRRLTRHVVQEESLARSSSMRYCMPTHEWRVDTPFYDDVVVVTPMVPVFREHGGDLLSEPWQCGIVHALAVDVPDVRRTMPEREAEIPYVMLRRAQRILQAAATLRANVLVLGAWGCGQAGHDSAIMAATWQVAIEQASVRMFGIIDFGVADTTQEQTIFVNFHKRLHQRQFVLS